MGDLVQRLRDAHARLWLMNFADTSNLLKEAADRIEALEKKVSELDMQIDSMYYEAKYRDE